MEVIATLRTWGPRQEMHDRVKLLQSIGIRVYRVNLKTQTHATEYERLMDKLQSTITLYPESKFLFDIDYPRENPRLVIEGVDCLRLHCGEEYPMFFNNKSKLYSPGSMYINEINNTRAAIRRIIYSNGEITFYVKKQTSEYIVITPDTDGDVYDGKSLLLSTQEFSSSNKMVYEEAIIRNIKPINIFGIAYSFVHTFAEIKGFAYDRFSDLPVICKIEDCIASNNIVSLCEEDAVQRIYVGRGDLGLYCSPIEYVPTIIYVCDVARNSPKSLIIGTDILESFCTQTIPSRSDMIDFSMICSLRPDYIVLSPNLCFGPNINKCIEYIRAYVGGMA